MMIENTVTAERDFEMVQILIQAAAFVERAGPGAPRRLAGLQYVREYARNPRSHPTLRAPGHPPVQPVSTGVAGGSLAPFGQVNRHRQIVLMATGPRAEQRILGGEQPRVGTVARTAVRRGFVPNDNPEPGARHYAEQAGQISELQGSAAQLAPMLARSRSVTLGKGAGLVKRQPGLHHGTYEHDEVDATN